VQFNGAFRVAAPLEAVWRALLDAPMLASCVPGAEDLRQAGPNRYEGTVKVRLGPIAASFALTGDVTADEESRRYTVGVKGRERLTGTIVQARFGAALHAQGETTHVDYALDLTLLGRLGQVGRAVLQDVARSMTEQTVACLRERLVAG
jgi:carbon-monoxide dehydrogenase small subunit